MNTPELSSEGIENFTALLKQVGLNLCAEDVMDILWLANQTGEIPTLVAEAFDDEVEAVDIEYGEDLPFVDLPPSERVAVTQRGAEEQKSGQKQRAASGGVAVSVPAAPALRTRLALGRALRPLMRKVAALNRTYLDEEATASQIAEQDVWLPVMRPEAERWLELALVVEESVSMPIWRSLIEELKLLTERQGAFRTVQPWRLIMSESGQPQLFPGNRSPRQGQQSRSPKELIDPAGRRLILLVSDCTSPLWRQRQIYRWMELWSQFAPMTLVQLLPQRLWERSALGQGTPVWVSSLTPGVATANWQVDAPLSFLAFEPEASTPSATLTIPVVTVEPSSMKPWAKVLVGTGEAKAAGVQFVWSDLNTLAPAPEVAVQGEGEAANPVTLVRRFRGAASIQAQRLAGMMAAVPVSPEIVDLIRQTLLPDARQVHVAEVFMSDLINTTRREKAEGGHTLTYDFVSEAVRDLLTDAVDVPTTEKVLDTVSQYIAARLGLGTRTFEALLTPNPKLDADGQAQVLPFAYLARRTLQRMGSEYAALVDLLGQPVTPPSTEETDLPSEPSFPQLQTFEFEVARFTPVTPPWPSLRTKEFEVATIEPEQPTNTLARFEFETATIQKQEQGLLFGLGPRRNRWKIQKQRGQGRHLVELLENDLTLDMVWVSGGSFFMGSPEDEPERSSSEGPKHEVTVNGFLIGRYPVTQAQWRFVARLPQEGITIKAQPSRFRGDDLSVEQVSWDEAIEFCRRLSTHTGREYRLPSEAEWEYACRAGTQTPFYFGETLSTDLANYDGSSTYSNGPRGRNRRKTTAIGSFPANRWGLSDMHGNVWEWCQDVWHSNYEDAPTDGSAWTVGGNQDARVLRGGSWINDPWVCRSAYRLNPSPGRRSLNVGFRVVCSAPETL